MLCQLAFHVSSIDGLSERCVRQDSLTLFHCLSSAAWVRGNVVYDGHDLPLRPEDITLPMVLRDAGYATALVGKWGLGYNGTTGAAWLKGFDRVYGQLDQNNCHNMCVAHEPPG